MHLMCSFALCFSLQQHNRHKLDNKSVKAKVKAKLRFHKLRKACVAIFLAYKQAIRHIKKSVRI